MNPPRFVSWAAVSSLPQAKKISVDDQLKTNLEHIEKWDGVLHKELPIRGKSRSIVSWEKACATIPEYAALRDMIEKHEFDVLIYLDRSRLGRKRILIDTIIDLCEDAGIVVYPTESPPSSLQPQKGNFAHQLIGAVESLIAQEEVTKMKHRHKIGMAARVSDGNFPGRVPYGWTVRYDIKDEKPIQVVEIDEEARGTIETILDLYVTHGASFRAIAEHLLDNQVPPPRDNNWTRSIVDWIVGLAWRYAGVMEINRKSKERPYVRAKSKWPVLITEETAKKVETERKRRARAKHAVGSTHLFSQIVWCGTCGRKMQARYNQRPSRRDPNIIRCTEDYRCVEDGLATHTKNGIAATYILDSVRRAIEFVQSEGNRQLILEAQTDNTPQIQRNLDKALARLAKVEEDMQRADDAYVIGKMSAARYQRQIDKLDEQRVKIEADIAYHKEELEAEAFDSQREVRLLELASEGLAWMESDDIPTANAWFRRHIKIAINNHDPEKRVVVQYL